MRASTGCETGLKRNEEEQKGNTEVRPRELARCRDCLKPDEMSSLSRKLIPMRTSNLKTKALLTSVTTMLVLSVTMIGATFVAAAKPTDTVAVDLDQCRNGGLADPQEDSIQQCVTTGSGATGWVNGNAGASNAHFAEGESISYRARLSGLPASAQTPAQVVLIIGYDVIHNGHDAIDYLTDKNRWQTPETSVADTPDIPCSGISSAPANCTEPPVGGTPNLIAIDPPVTNIAVDTSKTLANGCQTAGSGATQQPLTSFTAVANAGEANIELFGGTAAGDSFTYLNTPSLLDKNGDQEQQVQLTFSATSPNPVLAWGGHIASRLDWGCADGERSASAISGSPYHMRIKSAIINGTAVSLGNQDRSLSASAVVFLTSNISTTPGGSVAYTADVTDSLNVGVPTAGGTADFYLFDNLADCQANTNPVDTQLDVAVANGVTGTVTTSFDPGPATTTTYYWFVHYDGSTSPAVSPGDSDCTESVTITPPSASASGS